MRKLKLQMQISIDGYNSTGANDEQKWVTWAWDEIKPSVLELVESCDTELIGRKLAVDYIPFWEEAVTQRDSPMYDLAKIKAEQKKVVFTKTLEKSIWKNTELAKGNLTEEVNKLKKQGGKDIVVCGGSSFVANLIEEKLIDEFYLYVNPILLGKGVSSFDQLTDWQQLKLIESKTFKSGLVLLHYERVS